MTYTTITQKILGSDTYAEKKILASDINQIREAIQTGTLDIKPYNIGMEGNEITADGGQSWIRRSGNKFQYYDSGTWKEIVASTNTATFTAGEDIAIRDVVYINSTDGKIYKASDSNNDFIGIAKVAGTTGDSVEVYLNGAIVGGFSGLTTGSWYGLNSTAGTITENENYIVGVAISSTQLIITKPKGDFSTRDNKLYKLNNEKAINDVSSTNSGIFNGGFQVMIDKFILGSGVNDSIVLSGGWTVDTIEYNYKSLDTTAQTTDIDGIFFKSDGTKMYVVSNDTQYLLQYSLNTAWDVSTATYDNKSLSLADSNTTGVFFKPDGTKLYISGDSNNSVYQYSLSTAWDISTATYNNKSFDVSSQDAQPKGLFFKSDGTKMYIAGYSNRTIYQYSLSTVWDVSTATYDNKSFNSNETHISDGILSSDGTKLYTLNYVYNRIKQYTLSTAWDVSTATYDNKSFNFSSESTYPYSVFFKPDGTKLYIGDNQTNYIYEYIVNSYNYNQTNNYYECEKPGSVYINTTLQSNSTTILSSATTIFLTPLMYEALSTGDSITADISIDGGTTYTTSVDINKWVPITSTTGTSLVVKMNLNTADGTTTPKVMGWRVLLE